MSFKSFISIRPCWPLTAYIAPPSDAFSLNLVKWTKLMNLKKGHGNKFGRILGKIANMNISNGDSPCYGVLKNELQPPRGEM